jgi:hypothetical protein
MSFLIKIKQSLVAFVNKIIQTLVAVFNKIVQLLIAIFNKIIQSSVAIINFIIRSIKAFINKFKKPFHSSTLSLRGLLHALTVAVIIFVVLYVFKPFGLNSLEIEKSNMIISVAGIIVLAVLSICNFILPLLAKSFYDEHYWTGSKQLIQSFIMSLLIGLSLNFFFSKENLNVDSFPLAGLNFFALSIIPLIIFVYFQESFHENKYSKKAKNLNNEIAAKGVMSGDNPLKILVFLGNGEKLSLIPNQLIYAKINEKSSEFYYQNPFGIDKSVMDISENEVRKELEQHPQFTIFSKDLIINKNAIQKVTGTARGYEIAIAKVNDMVKVSNKYKKNLEKF